jgi:hypothetical protein
MQAAPAVVLAPEAPKEGGELPEKHDGGAIDPSTSGGGAAAEDDELSSEMADRLLRSLFSTYAKGNEGMTENQFKALIRDCPGLMDGRVTEVPTMMTCGYSQASSAAAALVVDDFHLLFLSNLAPHLGTFHPQNFQMHHDCIDFFSVCNATPNVESIQPSISPPSPFTMSVRIIITSHSQTSNSSPPPRLPPLFFLLLMQRELSMTFKRVEAQSEDGSVTHYADFVEALAIISDLK